MNSSGDDGDGGGAVLQLRHSLARSPGMCTCSMGMSLLQIFKLCTYWILLMNLSAGGRRRRDTSESQPLGVVTQGQREPDGSQGCTHSPFKLPSTHSPKPPSQPMPDLSPCPWCRYRQEHGVSACKKEGS